MSSRILLCMDDGMAQFFRKSFEENSNDLEVVKNISIFHSVKQALARYKPDILYLALNRIQYDSKNHKREILKAIYDIKTSNVNLRIAIQANLPKNDPFLKELATRGVYDIFPLQGQSGRLDMYSVVEQLSKPANIKNVSQYLSIKGAAPQSKKFKPKPSPQVNQHRPVKRKSRPREEPSNKINEKRSGKIRHDDEFVQPRKNKKHKLKQPRRRNKSKESGEHRGRKTLVSILILLIILGSMLTVLRSCGNKKMQTTSYDTLISEGKYSDAASAYPSKAVNTENKMLNDPNVKDKSSVADDIAEYSNADPIMFDEAYFQGNFKKAVDIYNSSNSQEMLKLSSARKTMLAYSYMKTGQVQSARDAARGLHNKQLNQKIDAYANFQQANEMLKAKIKSGNLSPQDVNKAKKQIKENKQAMHEL